MRQNRINLLYNLLFYTAVPWGMYTRYKFKESGRENIPRVRPCVYYCKHQTQADLWAIPWALRTNKWFGFFRNQPLNFVAARYLFKKPIMGFWIPKLGAFPIDRGHLKKETVKYIDFLLENNELIMAFPEATRFYGKVLRGNPIITKQFARYDTKKRLPIVPVGCWWSENPDKVGLVKKGLEVRVNIGKPLYFDKSIEDIEDRYKDMNVRAIIAIKELSGLPWNEVTYLQSESESIDDLISSSE
ncbi:1-acyl-sn-glycerol-3-phosphate acyltransferase [Candidatus Woesearchaeota archaeon]|nr:1-acyl-sn-glycerol-3-phosphate acyltransferase [Candidatus Woesearchaeota archaeon]